MLHCIMARYYIFSIKCTPEVLDTLSKQDESPQIIANLISSALEEQPGIPLKDSSSSPDTSSSPDKRIPITINGEDIGFLIGHYYDSSALGVDTVAPEIPPKSVVFILQTGNLDDFGRLTSRQLVENIANFIKSPDSISTTGNAYPVFWNNQDQPYRLCAIKTNPFRKNDVSLIVPEKGGGYWNTPQNYAPFRTPEPT